MLKTRHTKKNTFPKDVLFVHFFDLRSHIMKLSESSWTPSRVRTLSSAISSNDSFPRLRRFIAN